MSSNVLNLDLDFGRRENNSDVIRRLLPTIEHYRNKKKSLKSIHQALVKRGEVSMALQSFKNNYYAQRKVNRFTNEAPSKSSPSSFLSASSSSKKLTKLEQVKSQSQSNPSHKTRKIELGSLSLDEEIAAHQAQAKAIFESR